MHLGFVHFEEYFLQNPFLHKSQYASGLTIPPGICCFVVATDGMREGATSVLVLTVRIGEVVAGVDQSGGKSINPSEGAFIPPLPPAGVVTVVDDGVVVAVIAELGSMIFDGDVVMMGAGMFRPMADASGVRHGAHSQRHRRTERTRHHRARQRRAAAAAGQGCR